MATHPTVFLPTFSRPLAKQLRHPRWSEHELFSWLLDDVLADLTGQRKSQPPPVEAIPDLRTLAGVYARCVHDAPPFTDILGPLYMDLVSRHQRQDRGLFFTPPEVARLTAKMQLADFLSPPPDGRLYRVYELAAGSGTLLLASAEAITERDGMTALRQWSFTAVDLATDCARMTAVQLLANGLIHQATLGELLVFQGNALGSNAGLKVVVQTVATTTALEPVPPTIPPVRREAIQAAAHPAGLDLFCLPTETEEKAA